MVETTYSSLRENLASVMDRVVNDREVVIVRRKGDKRVAMLPADELSSLLETADLLRSPKNTDRLIKAVQDSKKGKGRPESLDRLRQELGLARSR
jgi:antitoxin YefM